MVTRVFEYWDGGKDYPKKFIYDVIGESYDQNLLLDQDRCFLCLERDKDMSDEHIIPQWILNMFKMHKDTLHLMNNTPIQFGQLKIRCCTKCNNERLSNMEKKVRKFFLSQEPWSEEIKTSIHTWMLKIFYGLRCKQLYLTLNRDKRNPLSKYTIMNVDLYNAMNMPMLHKILYLSSYTNVVYPNNFFSSIFEVKLEDSIEGFTFGDNHNGFMYVMFNDKCIIVHFGDAGFRQVALNKFYSQFTDKPMNLIDVLNIVAKAEYHTEVMTIPYKYGITLIDKNLSLVDITIPNATKIDINKNWDNQMWQQYLYGYYHRFGVVKDKGEFDSFIARLYGPTN